MPNSANTTWIVCTIQWDESSHTDIRMCDGRSFRSEKNALERYENIIESLETDGYSIKSLDSLKRKKIYKGVRAVKNRIDSGVEIVQHAVVFIDRNPVWSKG